DESLAFPDPVEGIDDIHPGFVFVGEEDARLAGLRVRQKNLISVLEAIQIFDGQFIRIGPVNAGDVVLARFARELHPADGAALRGNHACAYGGVGGSGLRIEIFRGYGVALFSVVDERVFANASGVELPECDELAIGTPAKTVTNIELFF